MVPSGLSMRNDQLQLVNGSGNHEGTMTTNETQIVCLLNPYMAQSNQAQSKVVQSGLG